MCFHHLLLIVLSSAFHGSLYSQQITTENQPAQLDIRIAGENSIRITLKPLSFAESFPYHPALDERNYPSPEISLREIKSPLKKQVGNLNVEVSPNPLTIIVT